MAHLLALARDGQPQSCWDALRQTFDKLVEILSVVAYERFAKARGGMPLVSDNPQLAGPLEHTGRTTCRPA